MAPKMENTLPLPYIVDGDLARNIFLLLKDPFLLLIRSFPCIFLVQ